MRKAHHECIITDTGFARTLGQAFRHFGHLPANDCASDLIWPRILTPTHFGVVVVIE